MKIYVKVKANSRRPGIKAIGMNSFLISVAAVPEKGKANAEVIETLVKYLKISKSRITIVRGQTSRNKTIKILE